MTPIKGILGEKLGMTQIFEETRAVPVTVPLGEVLFDLGGEGGGLVLRQGRRGSKEQE